MSPDLPEIFKYNSVISVPLFSAIAILLINKAGNFSFSESTISRSIHHLDKSVQRIVFRLNFLIKAILDLGFVWAIIDRFEIPLTSPLSLILITSITLFGLLFYFIEGKHSTLHKYLVYGSGTCWVIGQIWLAKMTNNYSFIIFSFFASIIPALVAYYYLYIRKVNVFVQMVCVAILYLWVLVFVFKFL